jgi:membrane-associated phospholipid phosphatase
MPAGGRPHRLHPARPASPPSRLPGGCVAAFALLAVVAAQPPDGWLAHLDASVNGAIASSRTATVVRAARAVSALAEPGPAVAALAAAAAVAVRRAGWQAVAGPSLTVTAGMTARRKLSAVVARQRPPAGFWLAEPEGFSLPSRHTALAALTAGACASGLGASRRTSHAAALLAAAAVGASRVCLGVHWPSDVLAGWLFAAGFLDLCSWLQPAARLPGSGPGPAEREITKWSVR